MPSNELGKPEIYVRPFPDVNKGRWQVIKRFINLRAPYFPAFGIDRINGAGKPASLNDLEIRHFAPAQIIGRTNHRYTFRIE